MHGNYQLGLLTTLVKGGRGQVFKAGLYCYLRLGICYLRLEIQKRIVTHGSECCRDANWQLLYWEWGSDVAV